MNSERREPHLPKLRNGLSKTKSAMGSQKQKAQWAAFFSNRAKEPSAFSVSCHHYHAMLQRREPHLPWKRFFSCGSRGINIKPQ
jgi:hypothetical protein